MTEEEGTINAERFQDENSIMQKPKYYFMGLPVELQLRIFSYFTPPQLSRVIAPVCKKWWELSKDESLWKKISFTVTSQKVCAKCCEVLLRCHLLIHVTIKITSCVPVEQLIQCTISLSMLKKLDLPFCKGLNVACLKTIVSNCPLIEQLNLRGCHPGVDYNGISEVVSLPNLYTLNLSHCHSLDDICIELIARKCQKLQSLNIDDVYGVTDAGVCPVAVHRQDTLLHLYLGGEELSDKSMISLSDCKKLSTLKISYGRELTDKTLDALSLLPCLMVLKLSYCPRITMESLDQFFQNPRLISLKDIELFDFRISDKGLINLAKTCKNLEKLSLPWCREITDEGVRAVIENCAQLISLELLGLSLLTGKCLLDVPVKLTKLKYLNIENCINVDKEILRGLTSAMPHLRFCSSVDPPDFPLHSFKS